MKRQPLSRISWTRPRGRRSSFSLLTRLARAVLLVTGLAGLVSCSGPSDGNDGGTTSDAGTSDVADACEAVADPGFSYPAGPYGGEVGEQFEDIVLSDCEANDVAFADILATSKATLFNVGAGWCQPCREETMELEDHVFRAHCTEGLAVVQVLFQDNNANPATRFFCSQWKEEFGLTFPVLVDPLFETNRYFDAALTPMNILVDRDGVIRFKEVGLGATDALDEAIEAVLAGEPVPGTE